MASRWPWGVLALIASGCASAVVPEPAPATAPQKPKAPPASFEQSVGAMSQYDMERAFAELERSVSRCIRRGMARVEAIGGSVSLKLSVRPNGEAASVHLSQSTLGDRETEKCIVAAARAKTWPLPKGGVGEARHEYVVESSVPVSEWPRGRIRSVMPHIHRQVAKCVTPLRGTWQATLYVDQSGRVASSGVAPPNAESSDEADCMADRLNQLRFGKQHAELSKVTFTIP